MKGKQNVIDMLNTLLESELTAIDQYFIHSRVFEDQGMRRLYERLDHEMNDEKEHASSIIRRILFLEGRPDVSKRQPLNTSTEISEMLRADLELEKKVVAQYKEAIALCETEKDYVTREMLESILEDTEHDHIYWLEQQLVLMELMGKENYIQSMSTSSLS